MDNCKLISYIDNDWEGGKVVQMREKVLQALHTNLDMD